MGERSGVPVPVGGKCQVSGKLVPVPAQPTVRHCRRCWCCGDTARTAPRSWPSRASKQLKAPVGEGLRLSRDSSRWMAPGMSHTDGFIHWLLISQQPSYSVIHPLGQEHPPTWGMLGMHGQYPCPSLSLSGFHSCESLPCGASEMEIRAAGDPLGLNTLQRRSAPCTLHLAACRRHLLKQGAVRGWMAHGDFVSLAHPLRLPPPGLLPSAFQTPSLVH